MLTIRLTGPNLKLLRIPESVGLRESKELTLALAEARAPTEKPMNEPKPPLQYFNDGAIARIIFNRPELLNAIDTTMASAFLDACRRISEDPMVRVVVLSGAGRAFMAGGDIAQFRDDPLSIP